MSERAAFTHFIVKITCRYETSESKDIIWFFLNLDEVHFIAQHRRKNPFCRDVRNKVTLKCKIGLEKSGSWMDANLIVKVAHIYKINGSKD